MPRLVRSTGSNITLDSEMSFHAFHSGSTGSALNPGDVPTQAAKLFQGPTNLGVAYGNTGIDEIVDLNRWPRVEMTPSMMSSYAAMKGRNADIEHDVLYGALYENKERHPDDVRVWLPRFDNMTANLYAKGGKSYWWDPLVEPSHAIKRKTPQILTTGSRLPWTGPSNATYEEHIRHNPPINESKDGNGDRARTQAGYVQVNGQWVDPDSEQELSEALNPNHWPPNTNLKRHRDEYALVEAGYLLVKGKWIDPDTKKELSEAMETNIIQNYNLRGATKDDIIKDNATKNLAASHFVNNRFPTKEEIEATKGDPVIRGYDPRSFYARCQFGDNGKPPNTKYPIINGKLLTPEYEKRMYGEYMDYVSDDEGDPRDKHITPAQFAQMALGANFSVNYAQKVETPKPAPEGKWKVSKGPQDRQIKRNMQFDVETLSVMTGEYSVPTSPSLVLSSEGVDPWRRPHQFSKMNPSAALDLDRQAFAAAKYNQQQQRRNGSSHTAESMPETYTSEGCAEAMASPGKLDTGVMRYEDAKKQLEMLEFDIYTMNQQNTELMQRLNIAGSQRLALQYELQQLEDYKRKSVSHSSPSIHPPSSDAQEDEPELTKNQKKNASRRKRDYKRHIADAVTNKLIEAQKQKVVMENLQEELADTLREIGEMELYRRRLEDGPDDQGLSEKERDEERVFIEEFFQVLYGDKERKEGYIGEEEKKARR